MFSPVILFAKELQIFESCVKQLKKITLLLLNGRYPILTSQALACYDYWFTLLTGILWKISSPCIRDRHQIVPNTNIHTIGTSVGVSGAAVQAANWQQR